MEVFQMKQNILRIIPILLLIFIFAGCNMPLQQSENTPSASIDDLRSALGSDTAIIAIASGEYHSMAVDGTGQLWAVGSNQNGQIGTGSSTDRYTKWTKVYGMDKVSAVACGRYHTIITRNYTSAGNSSGEIWVTGQNSYGQLGLGRPSSYIIYQFNYTGTYNASAIAACGDHTMIIIGGGIWATGKNSSGQLGLDDYSNRYNFTKVPRVNNVSMIATGMYHSLFKDTNGNLYATGSNYEGQLGLGSGSNRNYSSWTPVPGMNKVAYIACGWYHSMITRGVNTWGEVWATGNNGYGQLGFGDNTNRYSFGYTGACYAESIAAGYIHSLILAGVSGGEVWATGRNDEGELGLPDGHGYSNKFIQVTKINADSNQRPTAVGRVILIAAGGWQSFLISRSGWKVWATGSNNSGCLGLGDYNKRFAFEQCP
jgi:alpha-tubulin suppressor-like RCC1 family protein